MPLITNAFHVIGTFHATYISLVLKDYANFELRNIRRKDNRELQYIVYWDLIHFFIMKVNLYGTKATMRPYYAVHIVYAKLIYTLTFKVRFTCQISVQILSFLRLTSKRLGMMKANNSCWRIIHESWRNRQQESRQKALHILIYKLPSRL